VVTFSPSLLRESSREFGLIDNITRDCRIHKQIVFMDTKQDMTYVTELSYIKQSSPLVFLWTSFQPPSIYQPRRHFKLMSFQSIQIQPHAAILKGPVPIE
jgi:hypothetical protein